MSIGLKIIQHQKLLKNFLLSTMLPLKLLDRKVNNSSGFVNLSKGDPNRSEGRRNIDLATKQFSLHSVEMKSSILRLNYDEQLHLSVSKSLQHWP